MHGVHGVYPTDMVLSTSAVTGLAGIYAALSLCFFFFLIIQTHSLGHISDTICLFPSEGL